MAKAEVEARAGKEADLLTLSQKPYTSYIEALKNYSGKIDPQTLLDIMHKNGVDIAEHQRLLEHPL